MLHGRELRNPRTTVYRVRIVAVRLGWKLQDGFGGKFGRRVGQPKPHHPNSTGGPCTVPEDFDLHPAAGRLNDSKDRSRASAVHAYRLHKASVVAYGNVGSGAVASDRSASSLVGLASPNNSSSSGESRPAACASRRWLRAIRRSSFAAAFLAFTLSR
jgi:hypothetical protein